MICHGEFFNWLVPWLPAGLLVHLMRMSVLMVCDCELFS